MRAARDFQRTIKAMMVNAGRHPIDVLLGVGIDENTFTRWKHHGSEVFSFFLFFFLFFSFLFSLATAGLGYDPPPRIFVEHST